MIQVRAAGRGDIPSLIAIDRLSLTDIERRQSIAHWTASGQCLVALRAGKVVGYVAFSPVIVQGEELQWVGMAPLAVDENYRGQGLARQLVYEGLDSLNEFGYAAVVVLGDPAFYERLGFEPASRYDLRCHWPGTETSFQVHPLADDALDGVTGLVEYHDHFNRF